MTTSLITSEGRIDISAVMKAAHAKAAQFKHKFFRHELRMTWRAAKDQRWDFNEARRVKHPVEIACGFHPSQSEDARDAVANYDAGRACFIDRDGPVKWSGQRIANRHSFADVVAWLDGYPSPAVSAQFGPGGHAYGRGLEIAVANLIPLNEAARWEIASLSTLPMAA